MPQAEVVAYKAGTGQAQPLFRVFLAKLFITISIGDKLCAAERRARFGIKAQEDRLLPFPHQNEHDAVCHGDLPDVGIRANGYFSCKRDLVQRGLISVDLVENSCKDSDEPGKHDQGRAQQQPLQFCLHTQGRGIKRCVIGAIILKIRLRHD